MSLHDHTLRLLHPLLLSSGLLLGVLLASGQAQVTTTITPDGTLGTIVTQSGTVHNITGGTRPGNGPNLFHSFDRFNVGTNDTASFSGPTGIVNILSRVTGGQQSVIDGRLQSTIPGANLYLFNPSGVMFGSNASLDVRGSFHVSTADYLRFADGATFSAHLGGKSTFTVAPPVAFGFLGSTPAPITIEGSALKVAEGNTLSVVGGDIQIVGGALVAPSGQIQLASVASPGEALFSSLELTPDLQVDSFTRLGRLEISQGGLLDVSGNRGGTVLIRSGRLLIDQAQIFADTLGDINGASPGLDLRITADAVIANGALLTTDSMGAGRAGDVRLMASSVSLDDAVIASRPNASGAGGNIGLHVGNLMLTGGARIDSGSLGSGHGGDLTVVATEAISLLRNNSQNDSRGLFSNAFSLGDGGHLSVSAPTLTMDGTFIQAGTAFGSRGNAGGATVQVGRLTLTGGAQIDTNTRGSGRGGDLTVSATDAISITGPNSALFSNTFGSGDTGRMSISTSTLTMDGGQIQAAVDSRGSGNARGITIEVGQLTLTGGAQIDSSSFGAGQGGKLTVTAKESISISGSVDKPTGLFSTAHSGGNSSGLVVSTPTLAIQEGLILTNALNAKSGNAGDLTLEVGTLVLTDGAQIDSGTRGPGSGGKLTVTAKESITISGQDRDGNPSGLFSTTSSSGNAGGLEVSTPILVVQGGSILTNSQRAASGNAGNLTLEIGKLVLTDGAQIDSGTTGQGRGGNLSVRAQDSVSISGRDSHGLPSGLFSVTESSGNAGHMSISASALKMEDGRITSATHGDGRAGDLAIEVGSLTLAGGAQIASGSGVRQDDGTIRVGGGQGGDLTITARNEISITREGSGIFTNTFGSGNAGNLSISTPALAMNEGLIQATTGSGSSGNAGSLEVRAGRITLTDGAEIDSRTDGTGRGGALFIEGERLIIDNSFISAVTTSNGNGGRLDIRLTKDLAINNGGGILVTTFDRGNAGNLSISTPLLTMDNGLIQASTFDRGNAGNLSISTSLLTMDNSLIQANASRESSGNAGSIEVRAGRITLTGGAEIDSGTRGPGHGGEGTIIATDAISIAGHDQAGSPSGLVSNTFSRGDAGRLFVSTPLLTLDEGVIQTIANPGSSGNAGSIEVQAGRVTLTGGAQISSTTQGGGRGGNVSVVATDALSIAGVVNGSPSGLFSNTRFGSGDAGSIEVRAGRITLTGGAEIASSTLGTGRGGEVTVVATDAISLSGQGGFTSNAFSSGDAGRLFVSTPILTMDEGLIRAVTARDSSGNAGSIEVQAGRVTLTEGAEISSTTGGGGQGGNVAVVATDTLSIAGRNHQDQPSGVFSDTRSRGQGGNLHVQAQTIELGASGTISASSSGQGDAGNIMIQAGKLFRSRNGAVTTEAETADGGNITLIAGSRVELRDSQITATVQSGVGKGGNITFDPQFIILQGSQVRADAFGGPGGNINLVAEVFLRDPASQVSASSALDIPGVVNIQAPVNSISGAVAPLPQKFASAAELLRDRCAGRLREGRVSRFVLGGRDGVPSEPGSLLLSPLRLMDPRENEEQARKSAKPGQGQERAWHVQAGALEGLDTECARWIGQKGSAVGRKTYP